MLGPPRSQLARAVDLQAPWRHLEEMVPGVLEADGGHTWDWLAAVHQVDATVVGAERSRIHVHCRGEAPAVKAQVPDGAWTLVLHLHYEDGVAAGHYRAGVYGVHLDA